MAWRTTFRVCENRLRAELAWLKYDVESTYALRDFLRRDLCDWLEKVLGDAKRSGDWQSRDKIVQLKTAVQEYLGSDWATFRTKCCQVLGIQWLDNVGSIPRWQQIPQFPAGRRTSRRTPPRRYFSSSPFV